MKAKTNPTLEHKSGELLNIQKIKARILFGNPGPWSGSFETLLDMGIDVPKLYQENAILEEQVERPRKPILTCEELIQSEPDAPITTRRLINYDLTPLKDVIECGGIDDLIDTLRTLHNDLVEATLISYENGKHGIFENNPDLVEQLFYIKTIADRFDEIRMETYQLKDFAVEEI